MNRAAKRLWSSPFPITAGSKEEHLGVVNGGFVTQLHILQQLFVLANRHSLRDMCAL